MKIFPLVVAIMCFGSFAFSNAESFAELATRKAEAGYKFPAAPKTIPYSYVMTFDNTSHEGDEVTAFKTKYRVNPNAAPGERLTYLGDDGAVLPAEFLKQMEYANQNKTLEEFMSDFWCSDAESEALDLSDGAVLREDAETAVISLTNEKVLEMMDDDGDMPKKIRKRLVGEMTFSKAEFYPTHIRIWLSEPTTVKIVAKMKEMEFQTSCAKAPNGHFYAAQNKVHVRLKAMGKPILQDMTISISDLAPVVLPVEPTSHH